MIYANPAEQTPAQLVVNPTGEPYQPARLYYTIHNKKTVMRAFQKLRCMEYEPKNQYWLWYYEAEAKKLRFDTTYNKISPEFKPVLLGAFIFRSETEMILELDSGLHVPIALDFFDKRINRRAAEVTKMRLVNRFYTTEDDEEKATNREYTLDSDRVVLPSEDDLIKMLEGCENEEERIQALRNYMEDVTQKPLPEIQEMPVNYYEEGLNGISLIVELHAVEALERWRGNPVTQHDLLEELERQEQMEDFLDYLKNASEEEIEELKRIIEEERAKENGDTEDTVDVESVSVEAEVVETTVTEEDVSVDEESA
ncbi:MAG: hypothetical protein SAJ12_19015 [Jaaginema sp. PMC 1079.18]|nr:hypothetical protein [Jaaginema sp. PMC 1080.18]MEC4853078.1 hypothetical protein [Jaaginema sp. PMC 1079.18]MEC4864901.1 hypothetical protein [Jaaginema sp. PMC 1078.18]